MIRVRRGLEVASVILAAASVDCRAAAQSPVVRETQTVMVDSERESWRLEWRQPPAPFCAPEDIDLANGPSWDTGPCWGYAFGESGPLDLVRERPGAPPERLDLGQFFFEVREPEAALQRWPQLPHDYDDWKSNPATFGKRVRARPIVTIMQVGDYDHDGRATEFVLQVSSTPGGHNQSILVGISRQRPTLHAFGTVLHPDSVLILERSPDWDALLHAKDSVSIVEWGCGDHGNDEDDEIRLEVTPAGIRATKLVYECGDRGGRGRLRSTVER